MYCNIYLVGIRFCSRQKRPQHFSMLNICACICMFGFAKGHPKCSNSQAQYTYWSVCRPKTYRINDICHHFSLSFSRCVCFFLLYFLCGSSPCPSPVACIVLAFIWFQYTGFILFIVLSVYIYVASNFWFAYLANVSWYVMWLRIYRLL